MDFSSYYEHHVKWSKNTFGPVENRGFEGVIAHLRKEINELEEAKEKFERAKKLPSGPIENIFEKQEAKNNLAEEIADIIILSLEMYNLMQVDSNEISVALVLKQDKNKSRRWPAVEDQVDGQPIEHIKDK